MRIDDEFAVANFETWSVNRLYLDIGRTEIPAPVFIKELRLLRGSEMERRLGVVPWVAVARAIDRFSFFSLQKCKG